MARQEDICEVPGCTNDVTNKKRQLCGACASSRYYWNKRAKNSRGAVLERREKLQFWNSRLDWLFEAKPKRKTKFKSKGRK